MSAVLKMPTALPAQMAALAVLEVRRFAADAAREAEIARRRASIRAVEIEGAK